MSACECPSVYKPLNRASKEIRVLDLRPSIDATEPIRGSLRIVTLSGTRPSKTQAPILQAAEAPEQRYETISYAWGDSQCNSIIFVGKNSLKVPASAEAAIRRMRDSHSTRTLWIDAICINQDDIGEKGHQVSIMGDVYAQSTCNLVWLGESDESTASAIRSFAAIYREILSMTDNLRTWTETLDGFYTGSRAEFQTTYDLPAMVRFYGRPWFRRLWVRISHESSNIAGLHFIARCYTNHSLGATGGCTRARKCSLLWGACTPAPHYFTSRCLGLLSS